MNLRTAINHSPDTGHRHAALAPVLASYQLSGRHGLALPVVVFAASAGLPGGAHADLAHRVATCLEESL